MSDGIVKEQIATMNEPHVQGRQQTYEVPPLVSMEATRQLFERTRRQAGLRRLWALVRGRSAALITARDLLRGAVPIPQLSAQVTQIALDRLVASEERSSDFDASFAPLRRHLRGRWQGIAIAWLAGTPLPPVRLIQVGDKYIVRDGHHRISVARVYGATAIDAIVEQRFATAGATRPTRAGAAPALPSLAERQCCCPACA